MVWDDVSKFFGSVANDIRHGAANPLAQVSVGSYNSKSDRERATLAQAAWQRAYAQSNLTTRENRQAFATAIAADVFENANVQTDNLLFESMKDTLTDLLETEAAFQKPATHDLNLLGPAELRRIAQAAERNACILGSRDAYEALYDTLSRFVEMQLYALPENMPGILNEHESATLIPVRLIELTDEPYHLIQNLMAVLLSDSAVRQYDLFSDLRAYLFQRAVFATGYTPETFPPDEPLLLPVDRTKEPVPTILDEYLGDTPISDALTSYVNLALPTNARLEHAHVLGGTGHGKTQCLQFLLSADLITATHTQTSMVVVDSQGDLIRNISSNALFNPDDDDSLAKKLILIDPSDIERPPALNLFDPGLERLKDYSPRQRELVFNSLVDIYGRFFGKLLATELTGRQETVFRYLARLILNVKGATIHTLIELMDDITPFKQQIATLDPTARRFFEKEFSSKSFNATRQQIKQRLYSVLSIPTFDRLFSAPQSKINFFDALNDGSIILINTAKDLLKADGTAILGRFMLALIEHAIMERSIIPEHKRTPTWLYIDEAQDYFDETVETLLVQARKYKCGMTIAHQNLAQLTPRLRAVFMGNTSIKIMGGITEEDAKALDGDMRTTPGFLLSMKKRDTYSEFAVSIRNQTAKAVQVAIPLGYLEQQPRLTVEQRDRLLAMNRQRVGYNPNETDTHKAWDIATDSVEQENNAQQAATETNHRDIQARIKQAAQASGFAAIIEKPVLEGKGRIDIALERSDIHIAIEVSVTTTPEHELHNVQKCLAAGYSTVWVTSPNEEHLTVLENHIAAALPQSQTHQVLFLSETEILKQLQGLQQPETIKETTVLGYSVASKQVAIPQAQAAQRQERLNVALKTTQKKPSGAQL